MCWKELIQKNCFKIFSKEVNNPHVLSIFQFSDQNCESILSSKRTGGSNNSAMFDPPPGQTRAILIFSSPLIWASTCTSIFSRNHIPNSLHQYHLCQQARAPCHWVLAFTHEEPNCVKKWGEQELDVLILVALCMGIEMNVVAGRDPWILHMIGNSIRY